MPYRSRKQDRDQATEKRIADSYKGHTPAKAKHVTDTETLAIMQENPGITYSEALDIRIYRELAEDQPNRNCTDERREIPLTKSKDDENGF